MALRKKILLIEDEPYLARPLRLAFDRAKLASLDIAVDGIEGLKRAQEEKPDLIILDLILPKLSGFEVLRRLKENPETKDVPVVILSNLAREDEVRRGLAAGAQDYFVKTNFSMNTLMDRIQRTLSGAGGLS
ncbi:MAG: response regulator [Patescibacteria group bacterium]|nr:response regulator [Patescibacteria group bacterium]